jgi:hypothetical protein
MNGTPSPLPCATVRNPGSEGPLMHCSFCRVPNLMQSSGNFLKEIATLHKSGNGLYLKEKCLKS